MSDDLATPFALRPATAARPLLGLTVLLVEDSRFASEAMRLLCLRSGARIRRADTLRSAHRHLATYRPSAVIVDVGLPDGSGLDLIRDLARMVPRVPVLLGTSGDDTMAARALADGADGFLMKPIESLAAFQSAVLSAMPASARPGPALRPVEEEVISPDPLALREDLALAAEIIAGQDSVAVSTASHDPVEQAATLDYLAQFLAGVARISHDGALANAAEALRSGRAAGRGTAGELDRLGGLVRSRLAANGSF